MKRAPGNLWVLSLSLVAVIAASSLALGQTVTSGVRGTITDATGAFVPGAEVVVVNTHTGLRSSMVSDDAGRYAFTLLPAGTYTLEVQKAGFKKYQRSGVVLSANQVAGINLELEVGEVTQSIEISAAPPPINTQTSEVSTLVDSQQLKELPLNGRNVVQLATLTNGVSYAAIPTAITANPNGAVNKLSVNGNRVNGVQFNLDGVDFSEPRFNVALNYPNPDALQEFRFITSNYSAEFGRNPGGVMNVVTKSGTNEIHGGLWEFNRNSALAARSFFLPRKAPLNQNQFGFSLGGPAIKERLFWFGSAQWLRIREGKAATTAFPPTAAERRGDFSASRRTVIDPDTRLPFPGNIIPQARLDPIAVKYLALIPLPNSPDGRYIGAFSDATNNYQLVVKPDYLFRVGSRLNITFFRDHTESNSPVAFLNGEHNMPFVGELASWKQYIRAYTTDIIVNHTHALRPNLLNNFRFGFKDLEWGVNGNGRPTIRDLGSNFPESKFITGEARPGGPPGVNVADRFVKSRGYIWILYNKKYQFADNIDYIRGGHRIRFGFEHIYQNMTHHSGSLADGHFTGTGNVTGDSFADFLLGRPSASISAAADHSGDQRQYSAYFQDSVQMSRNLVVELGLRYQVTPLWIGPENRTLEGGGTVRSTGTYIEGQQSVVYTKAPRGFVYPASSGFGGQGDPGVPKGLVFTDKNNFAPRIGLAWDIRGKGKTALRAAWGIFYTTQAGQGQDDPTTILPTYYNFAVPTIPSLTNPIPPASLAAVPPRLTRDIDFSPYLPASTSFFERYLRDPRIQQFNLTIEQQLGHDVILQVGYVGNVANRLQMARDLNAPRYIPGNDAQGNPNSTFTNGNDRRPNRNFTSLNIQEGRVNSAYHSLQLQGTKRFSKGLSFLTGYTWSRNIDFAGDFNGYTRGSGGFQNQVGPDLNAERGLSRLHQAHTWVNSINYYTPSISRALGSSNKAVKYVFDDWQVSGIIRVGSGFPFTVTSGRNYSLQSGTDRPNLVGNPNLSNGRARGEYLQQYFNAGAFQPNALGTFGNAGRNILIGPGNANVDMAVFKNVPMGEKRNVQLRFEFFNLPNRPNFANPVSSLTSPALMRILSTDGPPRIIQVGLKFDF
ncbi:MAG: TonB-dependent receptor [Acidimicrobiia bacterium]|nr:TonB-dependent receptor [Acidimicrobiia bacterium]